MQVSSSTISTRSPLLSALLVVETNRTPDPADFLVDAMDYAMSGFWGPWTFLCLPLNRHGAAARSAWGCPGAGSMVRAHRWAASLRVCTQRMYACLHCVPGSLCSWWWNTNPTQGWINEGRKASAVFCRDIWNPTGKENLRFLFRI